MTDRLLQLANARWSAPLVRALGLPRPRPLPRRHDAFVVEELSGRRVGLVAPGEAALTGPLRQAVADQGGEITDDGPLEALLVDATGCVDLAALRLLCQHLQRQLPRLSPGARVLMLTVAPPETADDMITGADGPDIASRIASGLAGGSDVGRYSAVASGVDSGVDSGIGAVHAGDDAPADAHRRITATACQRALQGFMRSLAKEIGRRGATANLVLLSHAAATLDGALRFFCTDRSAYVSGQVVRWRSAATPMPIAGRSAMVTGAAGGIGAATARRLAREGLRVLCVDVPAARHALETLSREIGGQFLALDLLDPASPVEIADAARRLDGLDVLVHNAGLTRDRTLGRMRIEDWDAVMAVNLGAVLAVDAQLDASDLINAGAREICLSSISGLAGNGGQANYATSKAALIGYVAGRARQLDGRGITVNAVAPGFIETAMTARMPLLVREAGRRMNALQQGGRPEDVAEAIAFLATPQAQPLSGQVLRVCGQSLLGA